MATQSSDLDNLKFGVTIQTEGHTLTSLNGWNGLKEMKVSGNALSHLPSQSLVRRKAADCPEIQYCLEIQVILTKDKGTTSPPPHASQVPVVEDMLQDHKSGLTEAVVMGPAGPSCFMEADL